MNNYIKPDISFQSLSLTATASNDCVVEGTFELMDKCKQQVPGLPDGYTIFTTEQVCYFQQGNVNVCYHAPYEGRNVFGS